MKQTKQLKTKILAITNDMKVNMILAVEWTVNLSGWKRTCEKIQALSIELINRTE